MTRKDYVLIAQVLKQSKPDDFAQYPLRVDCLLWYRMCNDLANRFAQANKRFDADKFIVACEM